MASINSGLVWRSGLAAVALLAAAPLAAQDPGNEVVAAPPAPAAADSIGPRELSNFSINGTVTRPAEREPAAPATVSRDPQPTTAAPAGIESEQPEPSRLATAEPARPRPARQTVDPLSQPPTLSEPSPSVRAAAASVPAFTGLTDTPSAPIEADYGFSPLPWIAALLLLGAGAVVYFGRQRRGQRYAAAGHAPLQEYVPPPRQAPQPAPTPQPNRKLPPTLLRQPAPEAPARVPAPAPAPAPAPPRQRAGIVSTTLRPWIDLELKPLQASLTDEHVAIAFEVSLYNSGSAPARDVAVEACLLNVGKDQEKLLGDFLSKFGAARDTIPLIAPFARVPLRSIVRLPLAAVRQYQLQGRKLFMPMVAINAVYRWSSGQGQTGSGFLVGKDQGEQSDKLAPLRLDRGARGWKGLSARSYERGVRR